MRWHCVTVFAFLVLAGWAGAAPLEIGAVSEAQLQLPLRANERINPVLIKAQVLLDRAHFSPGEIDGKFGDSRRRETALRRSGFNSKVTDRRNLAKAPQQRAPIRANKIHNLKG